MKNYKTDLNIIFNRKEFLVCFSIIMVFVLGNFVFNLKTYAFQDVSCVPNYLEMMVNSDDNRLSWFITELYPILVMLPGTFAILYDKRQHTEVFLLARSGRKNYYKSKIWAVFTATFVCFAVPYLIELILYVIVFPFNPASHILSQYQIYSEAGETINMYCFSELYYNMPILYALINIIFVASLAGSLAVFALAISNYNMRYMSTLLLPIYLLLKIGRMIYYASGKVVNLNYADYIKTFHIRVDELSYMWMFLNIALLVVVSHMILQYSIRREMR